MNKSILLSHVFIDINQEFKKEIVDLCLSHYRKNNPNTFIVITGHGELPYSKTLDMCDDFFWTPKILPSEINLGHPRLSNIGIDILKKNGSNKFCKSRLDSIIMRKKIINYCDQIITDEKKKILITTSNNYDYLMGDLFIYGDIDFIKDCWDINTWYPSSSGLRSLGRNFLRALNIIPPRNWQEGGKLKGNDTWLDILKANTSYRDPESIRWIDLRSNWKDIFSIKNYKEKLLNNEFPYKNFIWEAWPRNKEYLPLNEKIFYEK